MSYNGALTARRSVAFTRVRLDDIKEFQRVLGATVNDVIVALCAGVLRRYAIVRHELPSRSLVAAVPVSERLPEHGVAGNQLSFMFYALPVHLSDPVARVEAVQRSAAAAKEQYSRVGVGLFADLATLSPAGAVSPAMRALSILRVANNLPPVANVIVSNIRGPDIPLWAAGARLSTMYPMGPVAEGVGLGITVVSYRDHVAFGFMACPDLVPDLQQLVGSVHTELEHMRGAVLAQA
jgi:WS/DGAT/MGAT family acyltransferase